MEQNFETKWGKERREYCERNGYSETEIEKILKEQMEHVMTKRD